MIDEINPAAFELTSLEELYDNVDSIVEGRRLLETGGLTDAAFTRMCQAAGLSSTAEGLLADQRLRQHMNPMHCMQYDWVHTCLQEGLMTTACTLFMTACKRKAGIEHTEWERLLRGSDWRFPRQSQCKAKQLHTVFSEYRTKSLEDGRSDRDPKIKANPSEMLGLYGLLRHAVETRELPIEVAAEQACFAAACKVVDCCLAAKRRWITLREAARLMRVALADYLTKHKAAYGDRKLKPKAHWMFDVAEQMELAAEAEMPLIDALVVERIHLGVKAVAADIKNTEAYERSVLERTLVNKLDALARLRNLSDYLTGPCQEQVSPTLTLSDSCDTAGCTIACGDVVFRGDDTAALVIACAQDLATHELHLLVDAMPLLATVSQHSVRLDTVNVQRDVWTARSARIALAWYLGSNMVARRNLFNVG